MFQAIEKLKTEKEKMTNEFIESRNDYRAEMKRINKAIRNFSRGIEALGATETEIENQPKRGMSKEIERILANGARTVRQVIDELNAANYRPNYQTVSGILQANVKAGKRFVKIAPATFALMEKAEATGAESEKELIISGELETKIIRSEENKDEAPPKGRRKKSVDAPPERTVIYEEPETATGGDNEYEHVF